MPSRDKQGGWLSLGAGKRDSIPVYSTIAAGLAATADGRQFRVLQTSGHAVYQYHKSGAVAVYEDVFLYGAQGRTIAQLRAGVADLPPMLSDLVVSVWGLNGAEWDGRTIPNEKATTDPTFNLIPDPFNPVDEDGGATPARTINDPTITDPDGGHNAMRAVATAQNQQNGYTNTDGTLPTDTYVLRTKFQLQSGGSAWRLGGVSTNTLSFTATGSWALQTLTLSSFANGVALGFSSSTGNSTGQIGSYNSQMYDPFQGSTYPTDAQEKAACGYHAKRPSAYRSSLTFDAYGNLDTTAITDGLLLVGQPDRLTRSSYAMGVWIRPTSEPTGASGVGFGFDFHTSGATGVLHGQLGVIGNNSVSYNRFGMLHIQPGLSLTTLKTGQYLVGQGWQHISFNMANGALTPYINGIPFLDGTTVGGFTAAQYAKFLLGSYNGVSRRRKTTLHLSGYIQGAWFIDRVLTQAEMTQQDAHGKARIEASGDPNIGLRKMAVFGCGDSITAFLPGYFWHLTQHRGLSPRLHAHLEAAGGTSLDDWVADPRKAFLKRQLQAAVDAGYDMALTLHHAGTNEIVDWYQNDYHGTGGFAAWLLDYGNYIAELKAVDPKVKCAAITMIPRGTGVSGIYSADALAIEVLRQDWNDYLRANYAALGFDYIIDMGLGTERIDALGNVTAETIPGGGVWGNYRHAAGCVTSTRTPATGLTLSATSGASFTGTAAAGTFTYQDVGRKLTSGSGSADITDVNADGSVATLSTTGYAPTPYSGEPAGSVTRDTIARVAFAGTSLLSGNWSVVNADLFQLTDGIHDSSAGGRVRCDNVVAPIIQAIQDTLVG